MALIPKIPSLPRKEAPTKNTVAPVKVVSQDKNLANVGANIVDPQVIFSFNKDAITSIFGPNYIMVNNLIDLSNADEKDYKNGVITTFNPTTLVNFTYSLFHDDSLNGSLQLVDNNNTFERFLTQGLIAETRLTFYFSWGYGTNRYHWSGLHKGIITDITYNIHEGHKVVDIQFIANPKLDSSAMTTSQFDMVSIIEINNKSAELNRTTTSNDLLLKFDKREKSFGEVIERLVETAAATAYNKGNPFSEKINVEMGVIDWSQLSYVKELGKLRRKTKRSVITFGRSKENAHKLGLDLAYDRLTKDIECFSYNPRIIQNVEKGKLFPGGDKYRQEVILNPDQGDPIVLSVQLTQDQRELQAQKTQTAKALALAKRDLEEYHILANKPISEVGFPVQNKAERDERNEAAKIKKLEIKLDKLIVATSEEIYVVEKFPVLIYKKPDGVPAVPYFLKLIKILNERLGMNLKVVFDDTRDTSTLFIGNDILEHKSNSELALRSNFHKNLYGKTKGLRRIRSVITKNPVLEDWETQVLNLSYNGTNGLIEELTVDIALPEFFKVANRIYTFAAHPLSIDKKKTVYSLSELLKSRKEIKRLSEYYRTEISRNDRDNVKTGNDMFYEYLGILDDAQEYMDPTKPNADVVSFGTDFMRDLKSFVETEKKYIQRFVAHEILSVERKFINIQIKMLGIPELDQFQNMYYGRIVELEIIDPVDREHLEQKTPKSWLSGKYFIKGIKHDITLGDGYSMILNLHKSISDIPIINATRNDPKGT